MDHSKEMVRLAYEALSDKKGEDIRIIDISQVSVLADYFIIANGSSENQVKALVDNVEEYLEEAKKMRALTEKYNVPLLIDDNIKLAKACGADGVHVGQNDMDAGLARQLLGPDKILGVTAKTVEQALKAQSQGADYLGSGAVFGTSTKKDARPMTMEQLQAICASVKIPVVAIGGICLDNIEKLQGSGAAGAAIVSGIFAAEDIEGTTRALRQKMERII